MVDINLQDKRLVSEQSRFAYLLIPLVVPAWFIYQTVWHSIGAIQLAEKGIKRLEQRVDLITSGKKILADSLPYLPVIFD